MHSIRSLIRSHLAIDLMQFIDKATLLNVFFEIYQDAILSDFIHADKI